MNFSYLSSALKNGARKSSSFSSHLFTESPQTGLFRNLQVSALLFCKSLHRVAPLNSLNAKYRRPAPGLYALKFKPAASATATP